MHGIKILPVYGGQDIGKQIRSLKGGVQLVIGTPGRVMDHLRRRTLRFDILHTGRASDGSLFCDHAEADHGHHEKLSERCCSGSCRKERTDRKKYRPVLL